MIRWLCIAFLFAGCSAVPDAPDPTVLEDAPPYRFCTYGIGGDWRILSWKDAETKEETQYLAIFPKDGPYDFNHIVCIVPGDHPVMALGKGKES